MAQVEPKMAKLGNKMGPVEHFGGNLEQLEANLEPTWGVVSSRRRTPSRAGVKGRGRGGVNPSPGLGDWRGLERSDWKLSLYTP